MKREQFAAVFLSCLSIFYCSTLGTIRYSTAEVINVNWTKIFDGKVQVEAIENKEGILGLRAMFVVSASKGRIWATLNDYENFVHIFEGIEEITVLEKNEYGARVEFWIDAVLEKYHYILYRRYEKPEWRITWKRVSGDLERIEGKWEIHDTPRPGLNLVIYESYVKVGGLIPTGLVRWGAMRKARKMGTRLRDWIERIPFERQVEESTSLSW